MRFARNPPRRLVNMGFRRFEREERGVRNEIRLQSAAALGEHGLSQISYGREGRGGGIEACSPASGRRACARCALILAFSHQGLAGGGLTLNSVRLSLRRRSDWRSSFPPSPPSSPIYTPPCLRKRESTSAANSPAAQNQPPRHPPNPLCASAPSRHCVEFSACIPQPHSPKITPKQHKPTSAARRLIAGRLRLVHS